MFLIRASVFSLFAVTVFWSFMADLFTSEQGKRLFGLIGAGGTAGALLEPAITIGLAAPLGSVNLLLVAIVFLELAVLCVYRLERAAKATARAAGEPVAQAAAPAADARIGGSAFGALGELLGSPYLFGIAAWVSLLSFGGTFLYLQRAHIVAASVRASAVQTRLFAGIDLGVGLLTLAAQSFLTAGFLKRFGVAPAAAALPALYVIAFAVLALTPSPAAVVFFRILQRTTNFAISDPARQIFTPWCRGNRTTR